MDESQRSAMFNAWKSKNDAKVKKCYCYVPNPRPTDANNCFVCNGDIYSDWFGKIRFKKEIEKL
jgi:hypothetical protein